MIRLLKAVVAGVAATSLLATPVIAMVGSGTAGAATTVVSPAGKYDATILFSGSSFSSPLKLNTNGTFAFTGGPHGTWTEAANVIHMTGTLKNAGSYGFVIKQKGKNLGSVTKPGSITMDGKSFANWYAVRG
jgi:hypothetical protein